MVKNYQKEKVTKANYLQLVSIRIITLCLTLNMQ